MFTRAAAFRSSSVIFISWFLLAIALGLAGAYRAAPDRVPTIQQGYRRLVDLAAAMGKGQLETPCPMLGSPCASRVARPQLSPNLSHPTTARICTDLAVGCATVEFMRSAMTIPTYLPFHVLIGAI
jgi:hypothetical protein